MDAGLLRVGLTVTIEKHRYHARPVHVRLQRWSADGGRVGRGQPGAKAFVDVRVVEDVEVAGAGHMDAVVRIEGGAG